MTKLSKSYFSPSNFFMASATIPARLGFRSQHDPWQLSSERWSSWFVILRNSRRCVWSSCLSIDSQGNPNDPSMDSARLSGSDLDLSHARSSSVMRKITCLGNESASRNVTNRAAPTWNQCGRFRSVISISALRSSGWKMIGVSFGSDMWVNSWKAICSFLGDWEYQLHRGCQKNLLYIG